MASRTRTMPRVAPRAHGGMVAGDRARPSRKAPVAGARAPHALPRASPVARHGPAQTRYPAGAHVSSLDDEPDPELEWRLRAYAVPAAFALAAVFHAWPAGRFVQRTFFTMPLHELGHAVAAWWSGYAAVPTLWKTLRAAERSPAVPLLLGAAFGVIAWRAHRSGRALVRALAIVAVALAAYATFVQSPAQASVLFTFCGDAGAMVIGALLVLTMFAGPRSPLRTNQLRWGFLVIGAASFVSTFASWWAARTDPDMIPFGEIEGVGLSDPSKLTEDHGWPVATMVDRYVTVAGACVLALAAAWGYATWRVRAHALAERAQRR